jgi:hypothetical protein
MMVMILAIGIVIVLVIVLGIVMPSTTASGPVRLGRACADGVRLREELLPAVLAAEIVIHTLAVCMQRLRFVDSHAANGISFHPFAQRRNNELLHSPWLTQPPPIHYT